MGKIKETKLAECQKEFLFNPTYGYTPLSEDYKMVDFVCEKTNKAVGANIINICIEDLPTINKSITERIMSCCDNCDYLRLS